MKSHFRPAILLTVCILLSMSLSSCNRKNNDQTTDTPTDAIPVVDDELMTAPSTAPPLPPQLTTPADPSLDGENMDAPGSSEYVNPSLPQTALSPEAFVPDGWTLWDHIYLDFNGDGKQDIVGVLDFDDSEQGYDPPYYPRVLFAALNMGDGTYMLDFQDTKLVPTRWQGGPFGDPYESLKTDGISFTINSYGGSSWKWSNSLTFKYIHGQWYLIRDEHYGINNTYVYEYSLDDYESSIGVRKYNNDSLEIMWNLTDVSEDNFNYYYRSDDYDLAFNVIVGPPMTLEAFSQGSQRMNQAIDEIGYIKPVRVTAASDISLSASDVKDIMAGFSSNNVIYVDENYILHTFKRDKSDPDCPEYLAAYDKRSGVSTVVTTDREYTVVHNGRVYYIQDSYEDVKSTANDGSIKTERVKNASKLLRVDMDGTGRVLLLDHTYCHNETDPEYGFQYRAMYLTSLANGFIVELHIEGALEEPNQYYLVSYDGGDVRHLGEVRGTFPDWLGDIELIGVIGDNLNIHMSLNITAGKVTGSYYYNRIGKPIVLTGSYKHGILYLYEIGATGFMYGSTMYNGSIRGAWTSNSMAEGAAETRVLPLVLVKDGQTLPAYAKPGGVVNKYMGKWNGVNNISGSGGRGSQLSVTPLFDDMAYVEATAYWNAAQNVHVGGFSALAVLSNDGLNYQVPDEKTYPGGETIVFRLEVNKDGYMHMYSNDYTYTCGAGVFFDDYYSR